MPKIELLDSEKFAQRVGVCAQTVRKAIKSGQLPHVIIGKRRLIESYHVKKFLTAKSAASVGDITTSPRPSDSMQPSA